MISLGPGVSLNFLLNGVNLHIFELKEVTLNPLLEDFKLFGEFLLDCSFTNFLVKRMILNNGFLYDLFDFLGGEMSWHGILEDNEEEILQMMADPCIDSFILVPFFTGLVLGLSTHRIL